MGECFVGSRYFTAFVENAFSLPWAMKTSILGPSIFTVISMKFLLGPLGLPRNPQDYFWRSPRRSQGRSCNLQGRPEDPWERSRDPLGSPWAPLSLPRNAPCRTFFERPRLAWSSPEQPWDAIFTTWSASGCRFPEILHKIVGHSADDVPMTFR